MSKASDFVIKRGSLLAYIGTDAVVRVPRGVDVIARMAFADREDITEVVLPKTVKFIEPAAFLDCTGLRRVALPEGLLSIGDAAFNGCENLEDITLPESLKELGDTAFQRCKSLRAVDLPDHLEDLGEEVFRRCTALERAKLPWFLPMIPNRLFQFCSALSEVELPHELFYIGDFAFCGTALDTIVLSDYPMIMGVGAFADCKNLELAVLSSQLQSIEASTFSGCTRLETLTVPYDVEAIGTFAFAGCEALRSLEFDGDRCKLRSDVFGYRLPESLYGTLEELWPRMTDGAVKQYVLTERGWAALSADARSGVFYAHHGKALLPAYSAVTGLSVEDLIEIRKENAPLGRLHAAPEAVVLREEQTGDLHKRTVACDGEIRVAYLADTDRAKVKLVFLVDRDTSETRAALAEAPIVGLGTGPRSGLAAILRRSAEPDESGDVLPDGELGGIVGNCDATLAVEGGRLVYTIEPRCAGCLGCARIDLGAATAARTEKMQRACARFQDTWLEPYVWAVKHACIDNDFYEDPPLVDEE